MAVKIKFTKTGERMNIAGCLFTEEDPVHEVEDSQAEYLIETFPEHFELDGVKKVDHKIPHLKKDVKAESYETKDIKVSEETKSEVIGEQVVVEKSAPKKSAPKKKGKR